MERRTFLRLLAVAGLGVLGACTQGSQSTTPSPETSSPSPSPSTTSPPRDPLPAGPVNALFFGTDSREEGSFDGLSDTIVLVQLSEDRERMTFVSVARDTYVPVGNGWDKINAAFEYGGEPMLTQTVSDLFGGIDIPITAQVNFGGFIAITRWLKGITVDNVHASSTTVLSTGRVLEFPEGEITLENSDALIYARQRKGLPNGDLDRTERHRALLTGITKGLQKLAKTPETFNEIGVELFKSAKVTGPITEADVPDLINPLMEIDASRIVSLMVPIRWFDMVNGKSVNRMDEAQMAELIDALNAGPDAIDTYVDTYGTSTDPTG